MRFRRCAPENELYSPFAFKKAVAATLYMTDSYDHGVIGNIIAELKRCGTGWERLVEVMLETYKKYYKDQVIDLIVPVPSSSIAVHQTGRLLGRGIADALDLPYEDVLEFKPGHMPSKGLPEAQKFDNAKDKVTISDDGRVRDKNVLLIDDLLTTGGTAHWCGHRLKQCGARTVYVLVAGRSVDERHLEFIGYHGRI